MFRKVKAVIGAIGAGIIAILSILLGFFVHKSKKEGERADKAEADSHRAGIEKEAVSTAYDSIRKTAEETGEIDAREDEALRNIDDSESQKDSYNGIVGDFNNRM